MCSLLKYIRKYIRSSFLAVLLSISLIFSNVYSSVSYADDAASMNPLFIPITSLVTAVALGSGIIAKNSEDAIKGANSLVESVINNIKSSEIQKSESDAAYDSPYRVINGGQPEKPNNSNKNGKWVALGGGAIASNELWANKDVVIDIMSKINSLGGYNSTSYTSGIISADKFKSTANASNVSLQLANISNSALKQFDDFLHSQEWLSQNVNTDDCYFSVNIDLTDIISSVPIYPSTNVRIYHSSKNLNKLNITQNIYSYGLYSNSYGSLYRYYSNGIEQGIFFLNDDDVSLSMECWQYRLGERQAGQNLSISGGKLSKNQVYYDIMVNGAFYNPSAFCGYIDLVASPFQFTQNVYNVNQTFDENFQNWLQGQIQLIGQGLMDAVRLGVTVAAPSWNPSQEQIQTGSTPASVIYQYINNYENPENIPDDEEEPDHPVVVPPVEEPQPTNDYLGNFLLPESITTKFPFCIPFDVARCLRLFSTSSREAPKWECDLKYGSNSYHVVIDLSQFDDLANFIRPLEYILFLVGLAIGTRSLMRG